MALVTCENLVPGYKGKGVCPPLTFSVSAGDYLCILGENGSGKTTLMKTLLGLQKPLSGTLTYADAAKRGIGYLPQQDAASRDFPASVFEIVLSGCVKRGGLFYSRAEKERARAALARLGIAELAPRPYADLSGGQQQRVLLCRALCAADNILLLDEPAAALDADSAKSMYSALGELHAQGITVIMISHDAPNALQGATHVLSIGREDVFFGRKEAYLAGREKKNA